MSNVFSGGRLVKKLWTTPLRRAGRFLRGRTSRIADQSRSARELIEGSPIFDAGWYLKKYEDVDRAGVDPLDHYLSRGWREGRNPGPMFNTSAYLRANEDVAASGINPLVHFLEYGLAEGRDGFGEQGVRSAPIVSAEIFREANRCLSMQRAMRSPLQWQRGDQLDSGDPDFVRIGDCGVGYARDADARRAVAAADELLRALSGYGQGSICNEAVLAEVASDRLLDGWYVNQAQLRTRWTITGRPLVVRAFQCMPTEIGEPKLVGEGVLASQLDLLDLRLLNPYFPILFVLAGPDGQIEATHVLPFPSLCRGGSHYAEFLWSCRNGRMANATASNVGLALATDLVRLGSGESSCAIGKVQVALRNQGNSLLDNGDLRAWLSRVLQIQVIADESEGANVPFRGNPSSTIDRDGGATLVLKAGQVPTIASLVSEREQSDRGSKSRPAAELITGTDPSKPILLVEVPPAAAEVLKPDESALPWLTSREGGAIPDLLPPCAIRTRLARGPSDEQLMVPVSGGGRHPALSRPAVTWLVDAEEPIDELFRCQIQSLALQRSAEGDAVALIGRANGLVVTLASKLFGGEIASFPTRHEAVRALRTPLVAKIGRTLVLHDEKTACHLASMLSYPAVTSASCALVTAERRGGALKAKIVDGGAFVGPDGELAPPEEGVGAAADLWGELYPVAAPRSDLWMTRRETAESWLDGAVPALPASNLHFCTSRVSATRVKSDTASAPAFGPPASPTNATRVERLVG